MGGAIEVRQGLAITVVDVESARFHSTKKIGSSKKSKKKVKAPPSFTLIRTTEVKVVGDVPPDQTAQIIRTKGLKVGMRFRAHHRRVSVQYAFGNALPAPAAFTEVDEDVSVTNACRAVFGRREQWFGFKIPAGDIPPLPDPSKPEDDRVYFIVTVENFTPNHKLDFDEVPVVAILASLSGFRQHYALGMGIFTLGKKKQSIQFDTSVIGKMEVGNS